MAEAKEWSVWHWLMEKRRVKLKYELPEADIEELAAPFLDIRKRVAQFPPCGRSVSAPRESILKAS
jgi:hypothetical protein